MALNWIALDNFHFVSCKRANVSVGFIGFRGERGPREARHCTISEKSFILIFTWEIVSWQESPCWKHFTSFFMHQNNSRFLITRSRFQQLICCVFSAVALDLMQSPEIFLTRKFPPLLMTNLLQIGPKEVQEIDVTGLNVLSEWSRYW